MAGWLFPKFATNDWIKALGDGFIRLIKMVIAPIIFCTVVSGIAHIQDARKVGRVGVKALVYFEIVSTFALILGLIVGNLFPVGHGLTGKADAAAVATYAKQAQAQKSVDFVLNIIPDSVIMTGTIRTFDDAMRKDIHLRIARTAEKIAEASGGSATVTITVGGSIVWNDPALTAQMAPTIAKAAGGKVNSNAVWMPSEDFPSFTKTTPGVYLFLGVNKAGVAVEEAAANHSTKFFVNEDAMPTGVKALVSLATDFLASAKTTP